MKECLDRRYWWYEVK
ncbi:TPA: hypothetical protein ACGXMA_002315 [Bacillus cereus]|nr:MULTISPECIES: hypothetical protein [Bacillus]MCG3786423.1 hypothetical protein [Bacillus sp. UTDS19-33BHI26]MCC2345104.1 hypothetical protein [Bacillus anthracis]MCU4763496.1 hypothetical protein [Bacillus cereus]MCU4897830.1 hypothetical protein [Bacillus cereus]MCU4989065.1 hypothetical protein [Bacillus cereus]